MSESTYDTDFYTWTQEQAKLLRDLAAMKPNTAIDWDNIIEEIETLGRSEKRELVSHMATVIEHLLKLQYSPAILPHNQWRRSIGRARRDAGTILAANPGLKGKMVELFSTAWRNGRTDTLNALADHGEKADLPEDCPYSIEQLFDEDWFPGEALETKAT